MKSSEAAELLKTEKVVVVAERYTRALFARVLKALKLMALVFGRETSDGNRTSSPWAPLFVIVRFAEIATAAAGMPQTPATSKFRVAFGRRAGPPRAPDPKRVSRTRQGVSG